MSDAARKIAVIVALDVAGYSARTEADEAKTTAEVAALRSVIEGIAKTHGGRVFNTAGDGFMLEFASGLSAVEAANDLAQKCEPKVRIGVHVGDVVPQPNGDLLGHGVNVAARLMAKAEPGSLLVSADVRRMIRGPVADRLQSYGLLKLDKMNETIEVFAPAADAGHAHPLNARMKYFWSLVRYRPVALAGATLILLAAGGWMFAWMSSSQNAPQRSDAPSASVAVLPFENLSDNKDDAFLATGIQDEILTRLTKIGSLKVISRTSTAHLASKPADLPTIAKQLRVATVLEGSVQRNGNVLRVNVQLINAATDAHVWAEIYDRKLDDIFVVQSEIAIAVANALSAKVTGAERQLLATAPTNNPAAYDAYLRGLALSRAPGGHMDANVASFFEEAVRRDPNFALAWAHLAKARALAYFEGERTDARRQNALAALKAAVDLRPELPEVLFAKAAYRYYVDQDYPGARLAFERVHALWPNDTEAINALGLIARRQGRWEESKAYFDRALALDPLRADFRIIAVFTRFGMREFDAAQAMAESAHAVWPEDPSFLVAKAMILQAQGNLDKADAVIGVLRAKNMDAAWQLVSYSALLRRRPDAAIATLNLLIDRKPTGAFAASVHKRMGDLLLMAGNTNGAASHYGEARSILSEALDKQPANPTLLSDLGLLHAALGDRDKALAFAERAVDLMPVSLDALSGTNFEGARLRIWSRFGDRDHAMPAIARLLKLPGQFVLTPAILRLDPDFDKLRGDPQFEALANSDAKPR